MKKILMIAGILIFVFAIGMFVDVTRSTRARSSLSREVEAILTEACQYLPYEPDQAMQRLAALVAEKNLSFVSDTAVKNPNLYEGECAIGVVIEKKIPLYFMRFIGEPEAVYYANKVGTVQVTGSGVVGVMAANRIPLAFDIRTGIDYNTQYVARRAGSFKPEYGEEYIQYFIVDNAGLETIKANDRLKLTGGDRNITDIIPMKPGLNPVFAAALKPNTDQVDGFCEFVITETQGNDLQGYFVNTRLQEAIPGNVPAVFYGLFAAGDKKIAVQ